MGLAPKILMKSVDKGQKPKGKKKPQGLKGKNFRAEVFKLLLKLASSRKLNQKDSHQDVGEILITNEI